MENEKRSVDKKYLFDNPQNIKRLLYVLYGCCALLLVLDFVIHRHVIHSWENLWGFYPIYGFVGCVVLVLIATWMRTFLMRAEDYYDQQERVNEKKMNSGERLNDEFSSKNRTDIGDHNVDV